MNRRSFRLLSFYVGKEYVLSFLVSFAFFFFIFFVNQILVLAQRILLKNVEIADVLTLVVLSVPQFLLYTMPFSSLSSASMVIGNFSSSNEITAMRSSGISLTRIFMPIVLISMVFSVLTLAIADRMIPYTSERYAELYVSVLKKLPTLEFEDYGSVRFGDIVVSNGEVDGDVIKDIIIYDGRNSSDSHAITASEATIDLVDIDNFTYKIELKDARILITDKTSKQSYSASTAETLTLYLSLNSTSGVSFSLNPSQMSVSTLYALVQKYAEDTPSLIDNYNRNLERTSEKIGKNLVALEENIDSVDYKNILEDVNNFTERKSNKPVNFNYQYYLSELNKKFALSLACTFLVFMAFPISFFKIRYGRLTGFGLAVLLASFYWFFLYFMHTKAITSFLSPALYLWTPDILVFICGLILLWRLRRH